MRPQAALARRRPIAGPKPLAGCSRGCREKCAKKAGHYRFPGISVQFSAKPTLAAAARRPALTVVTFSRAIARLAVREALRKDLVSRAVAGWTSQGASVLRGARTG